MLNPDIIKERPWPLSLLQAEPEKLWKNLFWGLSAFMLVFMVVKSLDYGIIWDEFIQSHYGKLVLRFWMSGGSDRTCLFFPENMFLYGGFFDTLAAGIYGILSGKLHAMAFYDYRENFFQDAQLPFYYETRHMLNACFGFLAIFFTGKTAKEMKSWRTACLAMIMLFLSPRFFGNAMNNPKDIPFAAAAAFFIYFMVRYLLEFPRPKLTSKIGLAAGIAAAINVKVGGLLFIGYFFLFTVMNWLYAYWKEEENMTLPELAKDLALIGLGAYLGGLIFWPYGFLNPIVNPLKALKTFSSFNSAQGTMLFEGATITHDKAPWYYIPKWIAITSPLFLITGLFIFFLTLKRIAKNYSPKIFGVLAFSAVFPVVYAILRKSVVYDSWRHFLFIYPPLILFAAAAWDYLFDSLQNPRARILTGIIFVFLFLHPVKWMLANHPNEYIYFNQTTGGLKGAFRNYETDYWGNCLGQASKWLGNAYMAQGPTGPAGVMADGDLMSSAYYLTQKMGPYYRLVRKNSSEPWDFHIAMSRGLTVDELKHQWPPAGTIYEVKADEITLCAVVRKT